MNTFTPLLIVVSIYLIGLLLIVKWIYDDAVARGMNPWGWILLTALVSPNFIGLIMYFLFRRKDTEITCPSCNKGIYQWMNFCYSCGTKNEMKDKNLPEKPTNQLLIIGVTIMVICIFAMLGIFFTQNGNI